MMENNWKRYDFDCLSSTNDWALANSHLAEETAVVCVADCQTKGRGRRGREWISPQGNLYMSLLFNSSCLPTDMVYIASLSAAQALKIMVPDIPLQIKWPNDIMVDGQKIGGILIEKAANDAWVVGIGLNLCSSPLRKDVVYPANNLLSLGIKIYRDDFIEIYLQQWEKFLQLDFKSIKDLWLRFAYRLGENVVIKLGSSELSGKFIGIDEHGYLLLQQAQGVKVINTGEIMFS